MPTSRKIFAFVLTLGVLSLAYASYATVGASSTAGAVTTTATVGRGAVLSSVSATGNVSAATQLSLSFQASGIVSEIDVHVGDHVTAGQVLAKILNVTHQASLASAQASLASAQAKQAQDNLVETPQQRAVDQSAAQSAQISVDTAVAGLGNAQATAEQDLISLQQAVSNAQANANQDATTQQLAVQQAQQKVNQDALPNTADQNALTNALNNQQASALKDQQGIQSAATALTAGQLRDQQAIRTAQQQLFSAQQSQQSTLTGNAVKQAPPTNATAAADQASVAGAQAQLVTAQTSFDQTILTAPVPGTVSTISGSVGGTSGGSSSSSGSSSSGSSSAASSTASAGSAGSSFMTLTDLQSLQVVAGFSESDAAKIQLGQPAAVTFTALPNHTLQGKVSVVGINSQVVSNVVTYTATVTILDPPASLKPGMTANVAVTTGAVDNVLTLPTSAVTGTGSTSVVQVSTANGSTVPHTITIGMRGDTAVEVTSGVNVGDKIAITRATGATTTPNSFRLPAGVGGLGGGLGGGGFGGGGGGRGG